MSIKFIFNNIIFGLLSFVFVSMVLIDGGNISASQNCESATASDCIIYDDYHVKSSIEKNCGKDISNFKEEMSEKTLISSVTNFNQTNCNNYYNDALTDDVESQKITGTCTIVATLSLVDYFYLKDNNTNIPADSYETFCNIFDACLNKGYTSRTHGNNSTKANNIISQGCDVVELERKGNTNWWNIYSNLEAAIKTNKVPIYFRLDGHSTVACGLTTYSYDIKTTITTGSLWWKKTKVVTEHKIENYVIVNEGYGRISRSVISTRKITSGPNGTFVCWVERK